EWRRGWRNGLGEAPHCSPGTLRGRGDPVSEKQRRRAHCIQRPRVRMMAEPAVDQFRPGLAYSGPCQPLQTGSEIDGHTPRIVLVPQQDEVPQPDTCVVESER